MSKYIFAIAFILLVATQCNANDYYLKCKYAGDNVQRCENKEVICYIYDSGWAGMLKSGRGAGISCFKKE
jgi:hypothetical protein